jgi:DNA-binding XRE family transcriptional regulator
LSKNIFVIVSGARLASFREKKGLDQGQLGAFIGKSRQTINTWEGKEKIKMKLLDAEKVAKALQITVKVLTGEKSEQPSFRDEIFEGDYIGLHKRVWTQLEANMILHRELIKDLSASVKNLTQAGNG